VLEYAGYVDEDALSDQLHGWPLRRPAREVATVRRDERHAEVEERAGAVIGGDFNARSADLVLTAMDPKTRRDCPFALDLCSG